MTSEIEAQSGTPTVRDLFRKYYYDLTELVRECTQRHCATAEDAEDIRQEVFLRLWRGNQSALFSADAADYPRAYLRRVVRASYVDVRRSIYGRPRPSTAASNLGATAMLLEELKYFHGFSVDEAFEIVAQQAMGPISREELEEMDQQLPWRSCYREFVALEAVGMVVVENRDPESLALETEREERIVAALSRLHDNIGLLGGDDEWLMRSLLQGKKVSDVAHLLGGKPWVVYRRRVRLLSKLSEMLVADGVDPRDLKGVILDPEERQLGYGDERRASDKGLLEENDNLAEKIGRAAERKVESMLFPFMVLAFLGRLALRLWESVEFFFWRRALTAKLHHADQETTVGGDQTDSK